MSFKETLSGKCCGFDCMSCVAVPFCVSNYEYICICLAPVNKCFSGPQMFKKWYLLNLLKSKISFSFFKDHFYIVISYWEADFPSHEYN